MKFTKLAITAALSVASVVAAAEMQNGYSVEKIDQCGVSSQTSEKDFVLFGGDTNRLTDWSHAAKIDDLKLDSEEYTSEVVAASTCNGVPVYQNVLVKKYANWNMQHVNGIEPQFSGDNIKLYQVESIVLEFKVSSKI